MAITTAYEQGVGKGRQAHTSGKEIANPYSTGYRCDLAWQYGYEEGKEQAARIEADRAARAAPQPATADAVIRQLVEALENHGGNYKLTKTESVSVNAALDAGRNFLAAQRKVKP